jgi:hypothetical protein
MTKKEKIKEVQDYTIGCNGTNEYHLYNTFLKSVYLTDGVKLVAENLEAYWMIDLILSYQTKNFREKNHEVGNFIQYWFIKVNNDDTADVWMEFHKGEEIIEQKIPRTDFPVKEFNWVYNSYDNTIALIAEG